jgi:hypothetical protein
MKNEKRIPGQLVNTVTCEEILISTGIQLIHWANDLAFTDAAYGQNWCIEAANRMATLSEILHLLHKRLPRGSMEIVVDLPKGVTGVIAINPSYSPGSASEGENQPSEAAEDLGDASSIDELPF